MSWLDSDLSKLACVKSFASNTNHNAARSGGGAEKAFKGGAIKGW